MLKSPTID